MTTIGVAVIGMGLMGGLHSRALIDAPTRFPEIDARPRLVVCADENQERAEEAKSRFGFERSTSDWQEAALAEDVDIVFICTPNQSHLEIAAAASAAGKHVFCEKPVGRAPEDTRAIADAVRSSGVLGFAGYVYRMPPLVRFARELIHAGQIGEVTHYRGRFHIGYARSPSVVHSWRFDKEQAGFGALGDLMSHVADLMHYLTGPMDSLVSRLHTFVTERPVADEAGSHFSVADSSGRTEPVTNDDTVGILGTSASGAQVTLEACRFITGPQCELAFDVHGTNGALSWNFERMNELRIYEDRPNGSGGWRLVQSGPEHPGHARFYPGSAVGLGFEDLATLQAAGMLVALGGGDIGDVATLADAVAVAAVQEACDRSVKSGAWEVVKDE